MTLLSPIGVALHPIASTKPAHLPRACFCGAPLRYQLVGSRYAYCTDHAFEVAGRYRLWHGLSGLRSRYA